MVRPGEHYNAAARSSPSLDPGGPTELELVNRAIEAVQSEMEKEKKKLSRIGEQEYDPANSSIKAVYSRPVVAAPSSLHSAYDPGSYQMCQTSDYNPTPRCSKYTLDSESNSSSHANSMEYVPTAVSKAAAKKAPSRTSSTCSSSSKNKYTLDNSKPTTDMEYDPLSNFSAKPGTKGAKDAGMDGDKRKRGHAGWQKQNTDDEYVPVAKKPRQLSVEGPQKYTADFETDEEGSGNEYRPVPVSRLQRRKSSVDSVDDGKRKPRETGTCRQLQTPEFPTGDDGDEEFDSFELPDSEQPADKPANKKWTKNSLQGKSDKTARKATGESLKKISSPTEKKGSSVVEKTSRRPSQDSGKKEKSHVKVGHEKVKSRESEKERKELKWKDGKSKKPPDKKKGEQSHGDKKRNLSEAKKPKLDKDKYKVQKNGRAECSGREKDKRKSGSKDGNRKKSSSPEKKGGKSAGAEPRSLSHVDLFGDESPDEEGAEEEEDERIVRKSASAFKRGNAVNKRKASDATETSSEDGSGPGDEADEQRAVGGDDVGDDGDAADFSMLQEDVEEDSDPMEECLRIFNESKYVKTEDKGRQAKQVRSYTPALIS